MSKTVIANFTLPHLGYIVTFWLVTILLPGNDTLTFVDCSLCCNGGVTFIHKFQPNWPQNVEKKITVDRYNTSCEQCSWETTGTWFESVIFCCLSRLFSFLVYAWAHQICVWFVLILMFLGHNVRQSKYGVEPVDTSGVDVVIKALKDLVNNRYYLFP